VGIGNSGLKLQVYFCKKILTPVSKSVLTPSRSSANNNLIVFFVPPNPKIGMVNDPLEKEADDLTDRVLRMPESKIRNISSGEDKIDVGKCLNKPDIQVLCFYKNKLGKNPNPA
jgi:hypothetical protein